MRKYLNTENKKKSNLEEALEFILNALGEMSGTMFAANFILFFSLWKPRVSCIILEVILDALDVFLTSYVLSIYILCLQGIIQRFFNYIIIIKIAFFFQLFTKCLFFNSGFWPALKTTIFGEIPKKHSTKVHNGFCLMIFCISL